MAVGRVWYGAKYSYGVWERFAHQGNTFPKTNMFDIFSTILAWGNPGEIRRGNGLADPGGMARGGLEPLPFKKLSKNPLGRA